MLPTNRPAAIAALALTLAQMVPPPAPAAAYPPPEPLPRLTAGTVDERYRATGEAVADAHAVAHAAGDRTRAASLRALADWDLLEFDPRGTGHAVGVVGDLPTADRIAVLVPGSHTTLDSFTAPRGPGGSARALADQARALDPHTRVAAVAWLGYQTPQGLSPLAATDHLARTGAEALRRSVARLRQVNPRAPVTLLCHSYGSVLCGYAASGLPVAELVLYGSPGAGVDAAGELATDARVWAGRSDGDWIRFVPPVRVAGLGFGADPTAPEFGARVFAAGAGGHGDYHLPGSVALRNLARIALAAGTTRQPAVPEPGDG